MMAGVIAAGRGERLASGGVALPKPLVHVGGETLIARIIRAAHSVGAERIACVVNDVDAAVGDHLRSGIWPVPITVIQKTTRNSLESFFMLAPVLQEGPFLLFTVDAVFHFSALGRFLRGARRLSDAQGVLALAKDHDGERPLRVVRNRRRRIEQIGEGASGEYITAGFYWLHPAVFDYRHLGMQRALTAFRQYLSLLCETGCALYGISVGGAVDVDRPADIVRAEDFLKRRQERVI